MNTSEIKKLCKKYGIDRDLVIDYTKDIEEQIKMASKDEEWNYGGCAIWRLEKEKGEQDENVIKSIKAAAQDVEGLVYSVMMNVGENDKGKLCFILHSGTIDNPFVSPFYI